MGKHWVKDKDWSDHFIPEIKRVLVAHLCKRLIGAAPVEEDRERNTDLIVLTMRDTRIAARVRRPHCLARFGYDLTIRTERPSGSKTEMEKIVEGWGEFMLYGFSAGDERTLARWILIDLAAFRVWLDRYMALHAGDRPGTVERNTDGVLFRAFDVRDFPRTMIVADFPAGYSLRAGDEPPQPRPPAEPPKAAEVLAGCQRQPAQQRLL